MRDIIDHAESIAKHWHKNAIRKNTGEEHLAHLRRVSAKCLSHADVDPRLIAVAWLHDIFEHTKCQPSEIISRCGVDVFCGVYGLTDPRVFIPSLSGLRRSERIEIYVGTMARASELSKIVKIAERIDNLGRMDSKTDFSLRRTYLKETFMFYNVLCTVRSSLVTELKNLIERKTRQWEIRA